jgi:hypothetical protein
MYLSHNLIKELFFPIAVTKTVEAACLVLSSVVNENVGLNNKKQTYSNLMWYLDPMNVIFKNSQTKKNLY